LTTDLSIHPHSHFALSDSCHGLAHLASNRHRHTRRNQSADTPSGPSREQSHIANPLHIHRRTGVFYANPPGAATAHPAAALILPRNRGIAKPNQLVVFGVMAEKGGPRGARARWPNTDLFPAFFCVILYPRSCQQPPFLSVGLCPSEPGVPRLGPGHAMDVRQRGIPPATRAVGRPPAGRVVAGPRETIRPFAFPFLGLVGVVRSRVLASTGFRKGRVHGGDSRAPAGCPPPPASPPVSGRRGCGAPTSTASRAPCTPPAPQRPSPCIPSGFPPSSPSLRRVCGALGGGAVRSSLRFRQRVAPRSLSSVWS